MINEINIRTNKSEFNPGEEVYGVVYLRIVSPTRGRGVVLRFIGYEQFMYEYKTDLIDGERQKYQERRDYIDYEVILYETEEPLRMCNTLFPFKIPLPTEIPGTFSAYNETDVIRWEATVQYKLEVSVIDANQYLNMSQNILILEHIPRGVQITDQPRAISVTYQKVTAIVFTSVVNFTARLWQHINRSGENAVLRVIITNHSSISVQAMNIKLLRSMILIGRKRDLKISWTDPDVSVDNDSDKMEMCVETRKSVINEQHINMMPFQKGIDRIQIPLRDSNDRPIWSTVNGQYIKCKYEVHIEVLLSNGASFELDVPVTVIWPCKDSNWGNWACPDWVLNDVPNVHHGNSVLRVPENMLSTPAFSCIPGFHPK